MKVIKHGNCLRFACEKCGCMFQANQNENGTTYRHGAISGDVNSLGYYRECPECGYEDVMGEPAWKKDADSEDDDGDGAQKHVKHIEYDRKYAGWAKSDKACPMCGDTMIYNPIVILTSFPAQRELLCPSCGHTEYEMIGGSVNPYTITCSNGGGNERAD